MNKRHHQTSLSSKLQTVALVVALVLSGSTLPVHAAGASTAQQAAQVALKQSGGNGKVLGVSTETDGNGRQVFAVKVLSNGRVRVVRVPKS